MTRITYEQIKQSEEINTYIKRADIALKAMGYTEHSFAHVTKVASTASRLLLDLGYDEHTAELAQIAGYMHDIGNVINRIDHAQSGAVMAFRILDKMGMDAEDIAKVVNAIGNHDESTAFPVNEIAAAIIIADKTDVRRSRVRHHKEDELDIHDHVNHAVTESKTTLDKDKKIFRLALTIDLAESSVLDYFQIFLTRMVLCRKAAAYFGLEFQLVINGSTLC